MGIGPSVGDFLQRVDDDGLARLVEEAYRLDPQRLEAAFSEAKRRCIDSQDAASLPSDDADKPEDAAPITSPPLAVESPAIPSTTLSFDSTPQTDVQARDPGIQDPMNALWDFDGHRLRELRPASANPYNATQQSMPSDNAPPGGSATPGVDADGHAVLYGSCGRDKRYARCAVCYFRGLRCNTRHYCACCQRPVCTRPRKYPGEEHAKICWNVLHVDKDMVQRVEKKKKRKLQGMAGVPVGVLSTASSSADSFQEDQREPQDVPNLPTETHAHTDAVALDPDPQKQLSDALSSTSVVI